MPNLQANAGAERGVFNATREDYLRDPRFQGLTPSPARVWLSSPTMHGEEQIWVDEAIQTNWVSTVGANIDEVEKLTAAKIGRQYAVGLSAGTAALQGPVEVIGDAWEIAEILQYGKEGEKYGHGGQHYGYYPGQHTVYAQNEQSV